MAATTSSTVNIPTPFRLHLLSLPQELQDSIFGLAYHRAPGGQIVERDEWDSKQRTKLPLVTVASVLAPYPGDKVSEFMVSKRYFALAAKAWLISQPLRVQAEDANTLEAPFWTEGILAAFARDIVGDYRMLFYACRMVSLKTLKLEIDTERFIIGDPPASLTERLLSPGELETSVLSFLEHLSRLSSFSVVASNDGLFSRLGAEEKATFEANAALIETTYLSNVTAGKLDIVPASEHFTPLYAGSRVDLLSPNVQDLACRRDLVSGLKSVTGFLICIDNIPPLIESTVVELLDIVVGSGAKCGIDLAKGNAFLMRTSLRAQAEERGNRAEARFRECEKVISQLRTLVAGLGMACLILVVGMVWKIW